MHVCVRKVPEAVASSALSQNGNQVINTSLFEAVGSSASLARGTDEIPAAVGSSASLARGTDEVPAAVGSSALSQNGLKPGVFEPKWLDALGSV